MNRQIDRLCRARVLVAFCFASTVTFNAAASEFLPHGFCYTWNSGLIWLHLVSDLLIGTAYFLIPFSLLIFVQRRKDLPFSWMFVLFGVFIVACGSTHWMEVLTLWYPAYWLSGLVKALTAAASLPTAVALFFLIPRALTIPSALQLREANQALADELRKRAGAEERLQQIQHQLEERVAQRTSELEDANGELQQQREQLRTTLAERERAELALRGREALLQTMLDNIPAVIYLKDANGRMLMVNWRYLRIAGRPLQEVLGKNDVELFNDPGAQRILENDRRVLAGSEVVELEEDLHLPDGVHTFMSIKVPAEGVGFPGRVLCGFSVDITERKRAEDALRKSREQFQAFMNYSPARSWIKSEDGRYLFLSAATRRGLKLPADRGIGQTAFDIHSREVAEAITRNDQLVLQSNQQQQFVETVFQEGEQRFLLAHKFPMVDADGQRCIAGTAVDITDQIRAERALVETDRRKNEFLATLAHELRNPLSPIRSASALLRARGLEDDKLRWSIDVIDRQVTHMARLLEDLMDMSRVNRNRLELRKERVRLGPVIAAATETSGPAIEAKRHRLHLHLPAEDEELDADPTRLAQVLSNLLNNAAKYTEPGGEITLAAEREGDYIRISVTDNGIGIEPDHLPHLFDMFTQAAPALQRSDSGLGIGLALVRGLVEAHGGSVSAYSAGPGAGSELTVRLPRAGTRVNPVSQADAQMPDLPELRPLRILIAEDNRDAAESLQLLLMLAGHQVRIVHNGAEAIRAASALAPEVVLLDIGLPGLNGYEIAERIRREPWGRRIILIAITGWGQDEDKRRAVEAGFDHHITKPVDVAVLERLLRIASAHGGRR